MISSSLITIALSFLAVVSASPVSRREMPKPSLPGNGVQITGINGLEWLPMSTQDVNTPIISIPTGVDAQFVLVMIDGDVFGVE
jgi:hypothetical protein